MVYAVDLLLEPEHDGLSDASPSQSLAFSIALPAAYYTKNNIHSD
jgi:hypothetical protein